MKKVCHFSSAHCGLDIRIFRKECVSLVNAGYDTHLVINATAAEAVEAAKFGVTLHRLEYPAGISRFSRMFVQAWRCYRIAKMLDADLYHFHDAELIPYGLLLAWSGKKVILDAHEDLSGDIFSKEWIPLPVRRIAGTTFRGLEHFGARRFSAVVAATPFIGSLFTPVANGVSIINNYPMVGELIPSQSPVATQRDSVCYIGGMDEIRGIREIVRAFSGSDVVLNLAGDFSSVKLKNELSQLAGWKHVIHHGQVTRQQVARLLERSFAGLVMFLPEPNHVNAQPNKMFEYMSAGVPVIASNFPLWREVIEGNECGLCVNPNKPEEISAAIRYLRDHPEEVVRMGENGRRAVEQKYRWDREEANLVTLYRGVLGA